MCVDGFSVRIVRAISEMFPRGDKFGVHTKEVGGGRSLYEVLQPTLLWGGGGCKNNTRGGGGNAPLPPLNTALIVKVFHQGSGQ